MNQLLNMLTGDVNTSKKERIMSVVSGAVLIAAGLMSRKRHQAISLTEFATGGALLLRGFTGHCPMNAAMGRNTATKDLLQDEREDFDHRAE